MMREDVYGRGNIVPAHVPAHLVREYQPETLAGVDRDAIGVTVDDARDGPDIFYGLGARQGGGAWVVTRHEMINDVFSDGHTFSSKSNANFSLLLGESWDLLPLETDPPETEIWRGLIQPFLSPNRLLAMEADIRKTAKELVARVAHQGESEFVRDFSESFPVTVFLSMMGLPLDQTAKFLEWSNGLLHEPEVAAKARHAQSIRDYLVATIADRRASPRADLVSHVVNGTVAGRQVTEQEALSVCFLLFVAGLDTVTSALGYIFKHLAENPDDQARLRNDFRLIPRATEEMMRVYPIVVVGRKVTKDIVFHGVMMKEGDIVTLPTMFAGRDERKFDNPAVVDLDRKTIAHVSFAAGPHRCLGMHLARRELHVALEEWLTQVPPFRTDPADPPHTHALGVYGVHRLKLVWDA